MKTLVAAGIFLAGFLALFLFTQKAETKMTTASLQFAISFPASASKDALDGRMLLLISTNNEKEPRFQISKTSARNRFLASMSII